MNGPGEFALLAPAQMGATVHTVAAGYNVPMALDLDHADPLFVERDSQLELGSFPKGDGSATHIAF